MSKYCPIAKRPVVYLECFECDEKICQGQRYRQVPENQEKASNEKQKVATCRDNSRV